MDLDLNCLGKTHLCGFDQVGILSSICRSLARIKVVGEYPCSSADSTYNPVVGNYHTEVLIGCRLGVLTSRQALHDQNAP